MQKGTGGTGWILAVKNQIPRKTGKSLILIKAYNCMKKIFLILFFHNICHAFI